MAKKAKAKAKKPAKVKAGGPPDEQVGGKPGSNGPQRIIDINTNQDVHVAIYEGKAFAGDGRLVYVASGPSHSTMAFKEAANKFALRTADNTVVYCEKGFDAKLPDGHGLIDIANLIENVS